MWSVVGQDRVVAELARSLEKGRPAHAYLLSGPARIGKARLALDLAKALNCTGPEPPCGACRSCRLIEAWHHPDVELVSLGGLCDESDHDHRRDGSKDIKICQVRRIERVIALRPFEGRTRVVIVDPADALNAHAADAFLKTLEEPPDQVVLILVSADDGRLPETILSRMRRIALAPVPVAAIREELFRRGVDAERAELLARLSGGRIGWALAVSGDASLLAERERRLEELEALVKAGRAQRMAFASGLGARFAGDRGTTYAYLDLWQSWWRDVLLLREGCEVLVANSDRLATLRSAAETISAPAVVQALRALRACRQQLEENANARLALEVLVLRLPSPVTYEEAGTRGITVRR